MRKYIFFIWCLFCCVFWIYCLEHSWNLNGKYLPKLGSFFSISTGFWQNVKSASKLARPQSESISEKGKVWFDEREVPHIMSDNLENAYFIQGYLHAMHRLWQMDFSTMAAEGRVSEIIGEAALDFDIHKRRKGLAESAKASVEVWKQYKETYALVESYSAGVNQFISELKESDYPIEYKIMNDKPRNWSPFRSSLFHKSMAEVLCGRDKDIELSNAKKFFGVDFDLLFPEEDLLTDPVIPKGTNWGFTMDTASSKVQEINDLDIGYIKLEREIPESGLGSNNWAVGKNKSQSGNPILCNDPHLTLNLPSIWYEQQILTPESNVYGVTFPGIPGVVIGFNKDIAWGITNAGWDVMDWYSIQWKDSSRTSYLLNDQWKNVEYRIENIVIKGRKTTHVDTVLMTHWGPVVYNLSDHPKTGLAMKWIISTPSQYCELDVFKDLNRGKNYEDYRSAISKFPYPAQNFAFISQQGDYALTVQGKMPIKLKTQGRFISNGSDTAASWKGFLPLEFNPHTRNPERGFISSANQKSTDHTYPVYYSDGDFRDYRGNMLNRFLHQKQKWSLEELRDLQLNNYSLQAETVLPLMINCLDTLKDKERPLLSTLKNWNYQYDSTELAPVLFDVWFKSLHLMVWDEITSDSTRKWIGIPSDQTTIQLFSKQPELKYYDLVPSSQIESLQDIIRISYDSLERKISMLDKEKSINWGRYKSAVIPHMARLPGFGITFLSANGTKDVLNAHAKTFGPSWRMAVELTSQGPVAFGVYPGGQDGRPGSKHYRSMVENWTKGKYYSLVFLNGSDDPRINSSK
ncbi:MAG: penicillin acylase family protein [Saprospiraceae bacterium]|nr:penicillin acylase family protein [Saprospiraceae bacterium]MBK7812407.1 penicillin acylase family protein [Saprospiraceae bacterium]MBK9632368.1 penicillin acylase family protein [Saprospiraceae bacterium]